MILDKRKTVILDEEAADWMLSEDDSTVDVRNYEHLSLEEIDKELDKQLTELKKEIDK